MREIIILAFLLSQGFGLDERNRVKVTAENKLEDDEADLHLHKLERRAIPHSKLILYYVFHSTINATIVNTPFTT